MGDGWRRSSIRVTKVTTVQLAGIGMLLVALVACSTSASPQVSPSDSPASEPSTAESPNAEPCKTLGESPGPTADQSQGSDTWEIGAIEPPANGDASRAEFGGIEWVDGIGWLAFGLQADGQAGLWVSSTGTAWTAGNSPPPGGNTGYRVVDVAAGLVGGCPRLVAVAQLAVREPDRGWSIGGRSVVLYTDDGLSWSLAATVPSTSTWLSGVTAAVQGFVAIGTESTYPTASGRARGRTRLDISRWLGLD
jgi:hypothetical protein